MQNNDQSSSIKTIIIIFCLILIGFLMAFSYLSTGRVVYYNCRDIDYLPDVPPAVRQECFDLLKEQYQKQKNKEEKSSLQI